MLYYLSAIGLIVHTYFWGWGLAALSLPRSWRRWAWIFAPGFGFALQSAVVWAGAHADLAGTDSYAGASELVPLGLLLGAAVRRKIRKPGGWWGPLLLLALAGVIYISPMTKPGLGLTSSSLGSCDQADYAAGARVFKEFARSDRTGFLGLPEVTKVRSADYFFDFWLRLNHFTPSALLAHNASIFKVEPYRIVSITAVALALLNLPLVLFLARVTVGVRGGWLLGLGALYALSPVMAYGVYQGALGQIYAAQGIGLVTLAVFGANRAANLRRSVWPFFPLVFAAFWILAGSYNFILPVCLAPAGAWLLLQLWQRRDPRAQGRVLALLGGAGVLCMVVFWGRFAGLAERFSLFRQYDFGWTVPLFSPEGWLGLLKDEGLHAWPPAMRLILSAGVTGLWVLGLTVLWRRNQSQALAALALVLPVLAGWGLLAWESRVRPNASYDAYKIIAVFYPCLLAGTCCWLTAARGSGRQWRGGAGLIFAAILTANLWVGGDFRQRMSAPLLRAGRTLGELGQLEQDPRFPSLNMLVEDYWTRLWANHFLLRKPQYFTVHTYEGRLNTALKGEWNLSDSLLSVRPLHADDFVQFNLRFFLVRAAAPGLLQAAFSTGWYPQERSGPWRWRWSDGHGVIEVTNPWDRPARVELRMRVRAHTPCQLTLQLEQSPAAVQALDGSSQVVKVENLLLQPGVTRMTLGSDKATVPGRGDSRLLAVALYDFELHVLALEK